MQSVPVDAGTAVQSLGEALLIGVLVGVQRESAEGTHPGLRDFILIALAGGICGLLDKPWLTAAALLGIAGLLALYHFEVRLQRSGITTELAGVATFCITYLAGTTAFPAAAPLAIGSAIAVVAFLEFKKRLRMFFRETITEREFNDTLAFLAVVLVIYPLLPVERYGPYGFFAPREVWFYVILISSISYAGYFLQKFLGAERGLDVTAVLGGIASSLAATTDLARRSREEPQHSAAYARAAVLANSVQFPRTLLILYAANTAIAAASAPALLVSTLVALVLIAALSRWTIRLEGRPTQSGNPFRLGPALRFGAMFAGVVLLSKAANAEAGWLALYGTSALGGVVDVGTVILSMSDLLQHLKITREAAVSYVFVALAANIIFKAGAALLSGTRAFAWRLIGALAIMFGSGVAVLIFVH